MEEFLDELDEEERNAVNEFLNCGCKYPHRFTINTYDFNIKTNWEHCIYLWELEKGSDKIELKSKKKQIIFPEFKGIKG